MASMRIPELHRTALAKIRQLSDQNIDAIVSALRQQPAGITNGRDIFAAIAPVVTKFPSDDLAKISDTLFSLYLVLVDADISVSKFASDVSDALKDGGEEFGVEDLKVFTERLEKLMNIDLLSITSKALSLEVDHANTMYEAKILTDVRPVFGPSVEVAPLGFVITHTLEIGYHDEGADHRKFYVALDDDDLVNLKSKIERAQKKTSSITKLMNKAGIRNVLSGKEEKN